MLRAAIALCLISSAHAAPMGFDEARHLLNRTGFGATLAEVNSYAKLSREEAVEQLLSSAVREARIPPPKWVNERIVPPRALKAMSEDERKAERRQNVEKSFELREWWYREMLTTSSPLTEKMTLFWHNHFVSSQQKVRYPQLMHRQNVLLRQHALGNFGAFLHEIARDPAMVIYLDSALNRKAQPNENFAREVMELFTLGEGNFSERDVKQAARAFTGWSIDPETGKYRFRRFQHDSAEKIVLGKSGNFDGHQVLDILLAQPKTAEFISRKLWREFISPLPNEREIARIAQAFRESGYEIKAALRTLFNSDAFYAAENRGSLIKSPVELLVGTLRQFEIEPENLRPVALAGAYLGQNIFSPPNVKGWPGGETWINSNTLLARKATLARLFRAEEMPSRETADKAARRMVKMERAVRGFTFDYPSWAGEFKSSQAEMSSLLLAIPPHRAPNGEGVDFVRALVLDPVYQLK
ncbi:MAG: DUF1800 domain-containing protein [Burkholderiales bacterium]